MKFVINTTKCDVCLFLHKMCCKMVWKFCEIWKSYGNWLPDKRNSVRRYDMYGAGSFVFLTICLCNPWRSRHWELHCNFLDINFREILTGCPLSLLSLQQRVWHCEWHCDAQTEVYISYIYLRFVFSATWFCNPERSGHWERHTFHWYEPRHDKINKISVRPAKTQISLGIRLVWSEYLLCAQCVAKDPSFLHADSEGSDQTGRMPRLVSVFAGRTLILLVLSCRGSY